MNEEQNIKQLPKDWKWVTFNDVCNKIGDIDHKMPKQLTAGYPYVSTKDFTDDLKISFDKAKYISREDYLNLSRKIKPEKGDIIFPRYGTIGKNILVDFDKEFLVSYSCAVVKPNNNIVISKYAYLYSLSSRVAKEIEKYVVETTQANIGIASIKSFVFPLPPLHTQAAIVSKIEELFSELDKGIENLHTAQQQLKVYKKSVLMDGVTGKLTDSWRHQNPKIESSEIVFEKIQSFLDKAHKKASEDAISKGKRKPKDQRQNKKTTNVETVLPSLPQNWSYYRLEDITYLVTDGTHFTPKYQESGIKFLSVKNVRPFYFREEHVKYISEEEHKALIERCNPQKGDILYTKVGATFGYAAKIKMDYEFSIFVSLCLIKPIHEYFSSDFLEILMNSELVFNQARKRVSGSGVPDLHLIEIRDFKIPLPSLEEQNEIVQAIESRLSVADRMEESITQSLQQAEALRQSILKKAFEGRLV